MAGRPVLRKLERWIEERGGMTWVFNQIADGVSVGAIAEQIVLDGHGPISRPYLYVWRDADEERKAGWAAAMKDAAHAHAEKAGEVWDDLPHDPTTGQVQRARGLSEYRRWLAGHRSEEYRKDTGGGNVILNVGELHLDALRAAGGPQRRAVAAADPEPHALTEGEDYEVVE